MKKDKIVPVVDLEFEKEYMSTFEERRNEIKTKFDMAAKILEDATDLCEKYKIPVYADISPLSQNYTPRSLYNISESFSEELKQFLEDNDCYGSDYGWAHSAVC